ncbi:MAG: NUDIX domain-containing protein [Caldilineaceae bacterium]
MHDEIAQLLSALQPCDGLEQVHIHDTYTWIVSGAPLFRTQKPATPPQHLVSYFVVVDLVHRQLLLTDHKDAGLWLPSGGHVEPNEHPRDTVVREAREELGIVADFVWPEPIFLTVTRTQGVSAGHTDVSLWYVLRGDTMAELTHDPGEFERVAWFAFDACCATRWSLYLARAGGEANR